MVNRRRIHRILPAGASASDAKRTEAEIRSALGRRGVTIPGDPPLHAIMELYVEHAKTLRSSDTAEFHALRAGPWLEQHRASEAQQAAAAMVQDMRGHYAPATINRSLGALKKALTLAWERGTTPENYGARIKRLPENNARDVALTVEQIKAVADAASEQVRAAIWIAIYTGCRRGEILALQPEDIGKTEITIRAGNTKTLRTRTVPIIKPLKPWLKYVPLTINFEGLKTGFRRARVAAGLPHVTFHDLRRSCGTLMVQAGVDLYVVSKLLGHSSVAVTQTRYAHLQTAQIRKGLEAAFAPPVTQRAKRAKRKTA
jgi:integrase